MAWNEIEAHGDPNLRIQAYYARANILQSALSLLGQGIFESVWNLDASAPMRELRLSSIAGAVVGDLIRLTGARDISLETPEVGDWFINCGVTQYVELGDGQQWARIRLRTGEEIVGATRPECRITGTASANMREEDDVSLVLGRRTSVDKFDLVAAGYRDPMLTMLAAQERVIDLEERWAIPSSGLAPASLDRILPHVSFEGVPDVEMLQCAIADSFDRFKHAIREHGLWRHLYDGAGRPAHESRHQALYRLCANFAFSSLRVSV
ncbi:hypothetical protein FHU30_003948 [Actinomadura rupiterrae]|nr:hypothetical protein [Actinomadura rupiterrae]